MKRSPLSDGQISDLLDPDRAGCRFVTGLPVMGLREVPTAIEQVLGQRRAWGKVEDITVVTVSNAEAFRREIEQVKAARGSKRMKLVFIKPSAAQVGELVSFAERWGQVKPGDVRPVFLLDATDDLLRDLAVNLGRLARVTPGKLDPLVNGLNKTKGKPPAGVAPPTGAPTAASRAPRPRPN